MKASIITTRRQAPIAAIAILAGAATLAIGALPLHAGVRAACLALLVLATSRELSEHWRGVSAAAVREDRRRVARDLHDGLAQELAFISCQSKRLAKPFDEEGTGYVGLAAQRALDESRTLIAALSRPTDEPLETTIARAARDVAGRAGACVELDVQRDVAVQPEAGEALARIVREAVTNAVRHGGAEHVRVELVRDAGLRLRVADDGLGIPDGPVAAGFGLISMRERAEALGGCLRLSALPGGGTSVEVSLP